MVKRSWQEAAAVVGSTHSNDVVEAGVGVLVQNITISLSV